MHCARSTKNSDCSTGPLARTAHLFAWSALLASLAHFAHSRVRGTVNAWMSQNDLVLSHSAPPPPKMLFETWPTKNRTRMWTWKARLRETARRFPLTLIIIPLTPITLTTTPMAALTPPLPPPPSRSWMSPWIRDRRRRSSAAIPASLWRRVRPIGAFPAAIAAMAWRRT